MTNNISDLGIKNSQTSALKGSQNSKRMNFTFNTCQWDNMLILPTGRAATLAVSSSESFDKLKK